MKENFDEIFEGKERVGTDYIGSFIYGNKQYDVYVYTNDNGFNPHVHILDNETNGENFDCCVRLDIVDYFPHGKHLSTMVNAEKKAFATFMETAKPNLRGDMVSNYETAVESWNRNNMRIKVEPMFSGKQIVIPDYRLLK